MSALNRIEKVVAEGMLILSAVLLAGIVGLFVMEIFMRYAMNAPTKWSNDVITNDFRFCIVSQYKFQVPYNYFFFF